MSIDQVIANKGLVKGFLVPIFYNEHTSQSALGPTDFAKVRDGYACARCLAEYVMYLAKCPVCQHERDISADLEDPHTDHVNHLKDRQRTEGVETGIPRTFDEMMAELRRKDDVDHVPLSKLKPRRRK